MFAINLNFTLGKIQSNTITLARFLADKLKNSTVKLNFTSYLCEIHITDKIFNQQSINIFTQKK